MTLSESPTIITILDGTIKANPGMILIIGYKHHYEMICEQSGQSVRLHEVETSKRSQAQLVAAVDLYDGQETELLLCYNRMY